MELTIAIPVSKELMLERTINRIKATCSDLPELVLVFDGDSPDNYAIDYPDNLLKIITHEEREGTSRSRHSGIINASNDIVLSIDSHMDFLDGDNWAERIVEYSNEYPDDILCCKMDALDENNMKMSDDGFKTHYGASLVIRHSDDNGSVDILKPNWSSNDPGIIGIVYGACYVVRKRRYIETLKSPWRLNNGWGSDEETISLFNWVCGGESRLIDVRVGHFFNMPRVNRGKDAVDYSYISNKMALLRCLPMSDNLRAELSDWISENLAVKKHMNAVLSSIRSDIVDELNSNENYTRLLDEYLRVFECEDHFNGDNKVRNNVLKKKRIYKPCWFIGGDTVSADVSISITTLPRSGSYMMSEWIARQMAGKVTHVPAINLLHERRNDREIFSRNGKILKSSDGDKEILSSTFEGCNPSEANGVLWVSSPEKKSILLLRNPFNWAASYIKGRIGVLESVSLKEIWCGYATSFLSDNSFTKIYYDKFVSDESYRDLVACELGIDVRTDESLDEVGKSPMGSSFTGFDFSGNALDMSTNERWIEYINDQWMIDLINDQEVISLLRQIEERVGFNGVDYGDILTSNLTK